MSEAPTAPYGAGDPFPKPILQTRFETVDDGGALDYSQARAVAVTAVVGVGIWVLGLLYVLLAVLTHGNA